ncbi:MAG: hypothetical protein ABI867_27875 [Kofleriaceae bacterium]
MRLVVSGLTIEDVIVEDPLLGRVHRVGDTVMTAIDWDRPTEIPALADPASLPPGAGGVIMNTLAERAVHAGIPALRYAGPYPTHALWRTLLRSFRTTGTEAAFTAGALDRMLRVARDPIPIDFRPAPHVRTEITGGHVEVRDGLERAVIDGIAYERDGSVARLVDHLRTASGGAARPSGGLADHSAEVWFGDARYARVARFTPAHTLADGPHPVPACTSAVIGKPFPGALVEAIATLVAESVPAPLAADAHAWVAARTIRWADLGARAAIADAEGLAVHAAIWQFVAPRGLGRVALALAEALTPVATVGVVRATVEVARRPR